MNSLNPNNISNYNPFLNKKKNSPFNEEQLSFIQELLKNGWSVSKICNEYNLYPNSIKKRIKNNDWSCAKKSRENKLTNQEILEIKEMVEQDIPISIIAEKFQISEQSILNRKYNNKWGLRKKQTFKYEFNENYFDEIDTEEKAYWLGFLMADGFITTKRKRIKNNHPINEAQSFGITLSIVDIHHLEKFRKCLNSNHPIHIYKNYNGSFNNGTQTCRLLIGNQHTVDSLKKWGIVENKTFFCKMPLIEEKYKLAFIRGYSDGDGSIYITKTEKFGWNFTGTKELLTEILKTLNKENLKMEQRWPERNNNNWSVTIYGKVQVLMLLDKIYENATIFLDRKYEIYLKMKKREKENPHKNWKCYNKYVETQGSNG